MSKTAQVRDERKKNITTKEKISTLKTSEHSDFEPFWHKKRYIIKMLFFTQKRAKTSTKPEILHEK